MKGFPKHKIFLQSFYFWGSILLYSLNSCNAPHNNPLDPQNENSGLSSINGTIKTISIPHQPIEGAKVTWDNFNITVQSDLNGSFSLGNIKSSNGWLIVEKEAFVTDSIFVDWEGKNNYSTEVFLISIPVIDSLIFYSIVEHKYPSYQNYGLEAKIQVSDRDNDIDTVFIINPVLEFSSAMDYNLGTKFHEGSYSLFDLGITSLTEIIGKDFSFVVKDYGGRMFNLATTNVKRIITEEVEITSPKNNEILSSSPTLRWKRFNPGYEFYYIAQIYTNEIQPELVWHRQISFDEIEYTVESQIPSGEYFWVIWAVDEFLNRSRSKPATFIIQ